MAVAGRVVRVRLLMESTVKHDKRKFISKNLCCVRLLMESTVKHEDMQTTGAAVFGCPSPDGVDC